MTGSGDAFEYNVLDNIKNLTELLKARYRGDKEGVRTNLRQITENLEKLADDL